MDNKRFAMRMKKELELFIVDPPRGISCHSKEGDPFVLEAAIIGPDSSPYEGGIFHLQLHLPENYPFFPPVVRFLTRIYHPNIDEQGRVCLDILQSPPSGTWRCTYCIVDILFGIQCLMSAPNPYHPLRVDIAEQFFINRELYNKKAKELTVEYAQSETPPSVSGTVELSAEESSVSTTNGTEKLPTSSKWELSFEDCCIVSTTHDAENVPHSSKWELPTEESTVSTTNGTEKIPPSNRLQSSEECTVSTTIGTEKDLNSSNRQLTDINAFTIDASENAPESSQQIETKCPDDDDPLCKKPRLS